MTGTDPNPGSPGSPGHHGAGDQAGADDTGGPMLPGTRADVPVEVYHVASGFPGDTENGWFPGFLEHRRLRDGTWQASVRYTRGVGQTHLAWLPYTRIRRRTEDPPTPDR